MADLTARISAMGLNDSAHAGGGPPGSNGGGPPSGHRASAYIPPHMRGKMQPQGPVAPVVQQQQHQQQQQQQQQQRPTIQQMNAPGPAPGPGPAAANGGPPQMVGGSRWASAPTPAERLVFISIHFLFATSFYLS